MFLCLYFLDYMSITYFLCVKEWFPSYIEVQHHSQDIFVTFNLAPENLGITQYFSSCIGAHSQSYNIIQPVSIYTKLNASSIFLRKKMFTCMLKCALVHFLVLFTFSTNHMSQRDTYCINFSHESRICIWLECCWDVCFVLVP